jgi:hypothetical protein
MALDPNKKFLYFNKDETLGESDDALCFPVSSFIGIETQTSARVLFYFEGSKGVDATTVRVSHNQHAYIKTFMSFLVDEINFGEKAFIKVYDHAQRASYPSDISVNMGTDVEPVFDLEDATIDLGTVLSVEYGGTGASTLTADGVLFGNGTSAISAVDLSTNGNVIVGGATPAVVTGANLAGSGLAATVGDGTLVLAVETLNQDTTGSAATLTTPRAINGVDFDGSAAITVTAAGSTLSDTVTVAKGGTGATSLTADGVLFGNGTSAVSAVDLSTNGNIVVGGSTPAVVTGANLAGSGLAATVGNGTLVLAVETLNQDTTGNADTATLAADATTLATPRAIFGHNFDGSAALTGVIASANLDADTAHLSGAQSFTGAKTFSAGIIPSFVKHSISGNATADYGPGAEILFGISAETTTAGAIYVLRSGTWTLMDADFPNRCRQLAAVAVGTDSAVDGMLIRGCVTLASAYTAGTDAEGIRVFASTTAGEATLTAPSASGDTVRILGYSLNAGDKKMFFNPDNSHVEIA